MTTRLTTLSILILLSTISRAQTPWFQLYTDSIALVRDANVVVNEFEVAVKNSQAPLIVPDLTAIRHTTPYFIYMDSIVVNLPLWTEVSADQQHFMAEVCGSDKSGRKAFALFFNGFYLAHELGHGIAMANRISYSNAYDMEYDANLIGMLYWRKVGRERELRRCYRWAKRMMKHLKNPAPAGVDYKAYLTEHYYEVAQDPYQYGYIQFKQFIDIYENKNLPRWEEFLKKW